MGRYVSELPSRPLTIDEVLRVPNRTRRYCVGPGSDEVYVVALLGENEMYALGFDVEERAWVRIHSEELRNPAEQTFEEFEAAIYDWAESEYGPKLDEGEFRMVGPNEAGSDDGAREDPLAVQMGLVPAYDCPVCEYTETGSSGGPDEFLEHLQQAHAYTKSEAFDILQE